MTIGVQPLITFSGSAVETSSILRIAFVERKKGKTDQMDHRISQCKSGIGKMGRLRAGLDLFVYHPQRADRAEG